MDFNFKIIFLQLIGLVGLLQCANGLEFKVTRTYYCEYLKSRNVLNKKKPWYCPGGQPYSANWKPRKMTKEDYCDYLDFKGGNKPRYCSRTGFHGVTRRDYCEYLEARRVPNKEKPFYCPGGPPYSANWKSKTTKEEYCDYLDFKGEDNKPMYCWSSQFKEDMMADE